MDWNDAFPVRFSIMGMHANTEVSNSVYVEAQSFFMHSIMRPANVLLSEHIAML